MATRLENLNTTLDNLIAWRADVSSNPQANYNIDGQSFNHADLLKMISDQIDQLQRQINDLDPFEEIHQGYT